MKTVLISGASSGIGHQIAKTFSEKNWNVILVARNKGHLANLSDKLSNSQYFVCDLSEPSQVLSLKEEMDRQNMSLNALINNAGIYRPQSIDDDSDEVWEQHFQTNLMGSVRLTRLCWPQLKKSQGFIVNISSTLAIRPIANTAAYSALKAAMNNWTLSLALEGAPYQIKVNCICPGIVDTPIHSHYQSQSAEDKKLYESLQKAQPLGRTGRPQDIAAMAYNLCQDDSQWITGTIINVDGGILLNS